MYWDSIIYLGLGALISLLGTGLIKILDNYIYIKNMRFKRTELFYSNQLVAIEHTGDLLTQFFSISYEIKQDFEFSDNSSTYTGFSKKYAILYKELVDYTNSKLIYLNAINDGVQFDKVRGAMHKLFTHFSEFILNSEYVEAFEKLLAIYKEELDLYDAEITKYYLNEKK